MDSKQSSAFLSLPPELCNRTYAYALLPPNATSIDARSTAGRANCAVTALLRSCQQIRAEASTMYFSQMSFVCSEMSNLLAWIRNLEYTHKSMVKSLGGSIYYAK